MNLGNKIYDYFHPIIYLLQEDKKKIPFIYFLILIVSLLDIIGIGLVGPIVGFVLTDGQSNSEITNTFSYLNILDIDRSKNLFLILSIGLVVAFFLKMIIGLYSAYIMQKFSYYRATSIVRTLTESALSAPYIEHIDKNNSEIISNIERYSYIYGSLMYQLLRTLSDTTVIIFLSVFMFFSAPILTATIFVTLTILGTLYILFFRKRISTYGEKSVEAVQKLIKLIIEAMNGFQQIKNLSIEKYVRDNITKSSKELSDSYIIQTVISSWPRLFFEFFLITMIVLIIQILITQNVDFLKIAPILVMFMYLAARIIPLFTNLMQLTFMFNFHMPAIKILFKGVKYARNFDDDLNSIDLPPFENISFSNVSFSYDEKISNSILSKINFEINKNEVVGIVGESGSGKSTLLNILSGFLLPDDGVIKYNGKSITHNSKLINSKIFYLPQNSFFIDDTIEKNIALGILDAHIDGSLVDESIQKVGLKTFIENQALGKHTLIGENGVKISGGQKQRLALARSFYRKRDIIILDESTNALDEENEKRVIQEISSLSKEKTFIIVSHQKSILSICDKVLEIDNGTLKIVSKIS